MLNYSFGDDSLASVIRGHLLPALPPPPPPRIPHPPPPSPCSSSSLFISSLSPLSFPWLPLNNARRLALCPAAVLPSSLHSSSASRATCHPWQWRRGRDEGGVQFISERGLPGDRKETPLFVRLCLLGLFLFSVIFGSTTVLCLSASFPLSFFPCTL